MNGWSRCPDWWSRSSDYTITEETIIKEENKDSVPINIVLKLLKEAKGIIGK